MNNQPNRKVSADGHAPHAPSSLDLGSHCHGWRRMSEGVEQMESEEERQGTATHWVGEQMLRGVPTDESCWINKKAPNGVIIDYDMYDVAKFYFDQIATVVNENPDLINHMYVETTLDMPQIHSECWGTPDCFIWDQNRLVLHIWDLKYGFRGVSAYQNKQMIAYAVGALNALSNGNALHADLNVEIRINIVQPRCYDGQGPVRTWSFNSQELRGFVNQIGHDCLMVDVGETCTAGHWCHDCAGAFQCGTLLRAGASAANFSGKTLITSTRSDALDLELSMLEGCSKVLESRIEAVKADVEQRIRSGERIKGRGVINTYTREKWVKPVEEVAAIGSLLGVQLLKDPELITPTQATALIKKKKIDPSLLKGFSMKKLSGTKVIKKDSTKAERIFNKGTI